jgi:hypothetical protein
MDFITAQHGVLLLTAVVFTYFGKYTAKRDLTTDIIESTIDSLINDGYIKTKGEGETLELLKHWES